MKDFQLKEPVLVETDQSGTKYPGRVSEKYTFPDTPTRPGMVRYLVSLDENKGTALVDLDHLFRLPRTFTKQLLRSFLRHSIQRENYDNAPWTIKDAVAQEFNIDNTLPRHLTQDAIQAWRKVRTSLDKSRIEQTRLTAKKADDFDIMTRTIIEHKGKLPTDLVTRYCQAYKAVRDPSSIPANPLPSGTGVPLRPAVRQHNAPIAPPAPPEPKYPREDLEVKPKSSSGTKPQLRFQKNDRLDLDPEEDMQNIENISSTCVGKALSIWSTLNIHSRFFVIDSFTYDNFIDAMLYKSSEAPCELFEEVHCAILKSIVNKQGEAEAVLPSMTDLSLSSNSSPSQSAPSTPKGDVSMTGTSKTGVDSGGSSPLSDVDQSRLNNGTIDNNAKTMLENYDWMSRIKDRAFENGGWQVAMIGLLDYLSTVDWIDAAPDRILRELAPVDQPATQETALRRYAELHVNLRLEAMECAVMLACTSKAFKDSMETRALQQTTDRKDKTEAQRRRKPLIDELTKLDIEKKMSRPEDYDGAVTNGPADVQEMDVDVEDQDQDQESELRPLSDDSDSDSEPMRGRRRSGRASDLKRKHAQLEREKEEKIKEAEIAAQSSERAVYDRIVASYEAKRAEIRACEEEIAVVDGKLRENSCHRTRILGIDRFCNRYWWFERNGMPFFGHEDSSTADYGYLNGRIWVQGPGVLEREGYFDITEAEAAHFRQMAGSTPVERRATEQGATVLQSDTDWGYYSTADEVRDLTSWLDDRGDREKKLLKEILRWRANIFETMEARQAYLQDLVQKRKHTSEEPFGITTRKKTHSEKDKLKHPCLAWTNGEANRVLSHLHSEGQGRKQPRGVARPKGHVGFVAVNQVLPGKRETRRGTKY